MVIEKAENGSCDITHERGMKDEDDDAGTELLTFQDRNAQKSGKWLTLHISLSDAVFAIAFLFLVISS